MKDDLPEAAFRLQNMLSVTTHHWKEPLPKKNKPRKKTPKVKTPWRKWNGD